MSFCVALVKFTWITGVVSLTFHSSAPIFVKSMDLPQPCWIPGEIFIFRVIIYILEVIFYIEVVFLLGVFDGFYLMFCSELQVQLQLLCKVISDINIGADASLSHEEMCWQKMKEYSNYHRFLIRYDT